MKKILYLITMLVCVNLLVSCEGMNMRTTPDGCVLVCQKRGDVDVCAGVCPNGEKMVEWKAMRGTKEVAVRAGSDAEGARYVQWQEPQLDGGLETARATYRKDGSYKLTILKDGVFVKYEPSAKDSLYVGLPPSVPPRVSVNITSAE